MVRSHVPSVSSAPPAPAEGRDPAAFYGLCALLWGLFCFIAFYTPVLLDDWYQVAWHQRHSLTLANLWSYAHYNYFNYNPRLGENFLLLVNGPLAIHVLVTPTVELAFAGHPRHEVGPPIHVPTEHEEGRAHASRA